MKHRRPAPFILLATCSNCKIDFQNGAARHMLGSYPLEQFCTYTCAENYLENDHGLKRAIPVTPMICGKEDFRHFEKGENQPAPALTTKSRDC